MTASKMQSDNMYEQLYRRYEQGAQSEQGKWLVRAAIESIRGLDSMIILRLKKSLNL